MHVHVNMIWTIGTIRNIYPALNWTLEFGCIAMDMELYCD